MTDPERDHLRQYIGQLERSRGRWRLAALGLAVLLALPCVLVGLLGVAWLPSVQMQRREAEMRALEAREAEMQARQAAEQARAQAEEALRRAEKERQERPKQREKDRD